MFFVFNILQYLQYSHLGKVRNLEISRRQQHFIVLITKLKVSYNWNQLIEAYRFPEINKKSIMLGSRVNKSKLNVDSGSTTCQYILTLIY